MPAAVVERRVLGHGGKNWITKTPVPGATLGGEGALPKFVTFVAGALVRSGHPTGRAIALAIGAIQRWARGEGHVSALTRKRSIEALAQWEAKRAASHAKPNKGRHLSNGARVTVDLAFNPSQVRAPAGGPTGGQWAAQGGTAPGDSSTPQGRAWSKNQIGNYPPGMVKPADKKKWDNWFRFFAMTPEQQKAFLEAAKNKKPTRPKGAPRGPRRKHLSNRAGVTINLASTPPQETAGARKAAAKRGAALPDGSFPTQDVAHLKKAIRSVGRAKNVSRPRLARYLKRRANALGVPGAVKGTWVEKELSGT